MFRPPTKYSEYLQDVRKSIDYILSRVNSTTVGTLQQVTNAGSTTTNAITTGGITTDYVQLNTLATPTLAPGMFAWNDAFGTADLRLKGGNVTLQLGQETLARVVNKTGADLLESQYRVVRVRIASEGGSQGQRLAVVLAQGNNDPDSVTTLGIVTETILNNQEGFITVFGNVNNIDTTGSLQGETWLDGDVLYLSPTIPGALTKVKPIAPSHSVTMGYVIYAHGVNGKIFVKVDNGYELDELHNVRITAVANNDLLQYDSVQQVWKNVAASVAVPTPTLAQVTTAGNTTTNAITVGNINVGSTSIAGSKITIESSSRSDIVLRSSGSLNDTFTIYAFGGAYGSSYAQFGTNDGVSSSAQGGAIYTDSRGGVAPIRFMVKGTGTTSMSTAMSIYTTTNVGIGTTTDAGYKLDVNGTGRFSGGVFQSMGTQSLNFLTAGATAQTSDRGIFIGNGTFTPGIVNLGIGNAINIGSGNGNVAIGYNANASGASIAITRGITGAVASGGGIAIGGTAGTSAVAIMGTAGGNAVAIGNGTNATQSGNVAIGEQAIANATISMAIGDRAKANHNFSVALGLGSKTSAANEFVAGGYFVPGGYGIYNVYFGSGPQGDQTNVINGESYTINGSGGFGTDKNGGNITIAGGKGTGTGTPGSIIFSTATVTTTGTTLQTLSEKMRISSAGNLLVGTTTDSGAKVTVAGSITAASLIARGVYFNNTLVAAANNDVLVGLDINPTFTNGAFTGVTNWGLRVQGMVSAYSGVTTYSNSAANTYAPLISNVARSDSSPSYTFYGYPALGIGFTNTDIALGFYNGGLKMKLFATGNLSIGTTTDAGYKLDISGRIRSTGTNGLILHDGTYGAKVWSNGYIFTIEKEGTYGPSTYLFKYNDGSTALNLSALTSIIGLGGGDDGVMMSRNVYARHDAAFGFTSYGATTKYKAIQALFTDNNTSGVAFNYKTGGTDTEAMRITSAGYIGVGTTTPTDIFHIVNNSTGNKFARISAGAADASAAWVAQNDQVDNIVYRVFGSGVAGFQMGIALARSASLIANLDGTGKFLIGTYSNTDIIFGTGDQSRIRVSGSNGNVMIGTLTDIGTKLNVSGEINSAGYRVNNVFGWSGTINIPTTPPISITVDGGIITNVV